VLAAGGSRALRAQAGPAPAALSVSPRGRRLVVLGASFGGISGALTVRRLVPDAEVVLLEQAAFFVFAPGAVRYVFGVTPFEGIARPYGPPGTRGLAPLRATVLALDRDRRQLVTTVGRIAYDHLLLAAGLRLAPEEILGLPAAEGEVSLTPYDGAASLLALRRRIAAFRGGHVVIGTPEGPYKCPPAPYEYALAWARYFRTRGLRGRVTLIDPRSRPTPLALAPGLLRAMALHRDVLAYEPFTRVLSVDPAAGTVETEVGRLRFDLLSLVPPHRLPRFLADAALGDPFVEVDAQTFRTVGDERIYAVGDVADTPYARTAFTAVSSGRIAGHAIARALGASTAVPAPPENLCFPQVSATGALRIHTTWTHELDAGGTPHVRTAGSVDNRATPESLRRRGEWEASVTRELFGGA
jgi:NADPH-dependent 2,4-dienoyl-CoA reductase/sulfur reductase-like enzyme